MRTFPLYVFTGLLTLAACKDPPPPEAPPEPQKIIEAEPPAAPTPTTAPQPATPTTAAAIAIRPIIADGAKFQFSLHESPDALKLQTERCATESKGDAAKQALCLATVEAEGAKEGVRFEQAGDKLEWVSYGTDKAGQEEIFLRGPIALLDAPADELHFRPAGAFTGKQAGDADFDKFPVDKFITVKAIDAKTIVMQAPPPKGALMYHRQ